MKNQKEQKIIYYEDELNDEFAGDNIIPRKIDENYNYGDNSFWWKLKSFFWYRIIAHPIAFFFLYFYYHLKFVNKNVLKSYKHSAKFLYGNHTNNLADALIPTFLQDPNKNFVIVNPNNVSMPILGKITPYLGAIPLPDTISATKNFMKIIEMRIQSKNTITIYPEAHIWPFYTKIRPFTDLSFRYPVSYKVPVFCFTNTYQKRKFSKTPKIVTYIDGPFFADENLPPKERRKKLRDEVFEKMTERSKNNNVEIIKYIKKEKIASPSGSQ